MKRYTLYKNRYFSYNGITEKTEINVFNDIEKAETARKEMQSKYKTYNEIANGKQIVFFSIDY